MEGAKRLLAKSRQRDRHDRRRLLKLSWRSSRIRGKTLIFTGPRHDGKGSRGVRSSSLRPSLCDAELGCELGGAMLGERLVTVVAPSIPSTSIRMSDARNLCKPGSDYSGSLFDLPHVPRFCVSEGVRLWSRASTSTEAETALAAGLCFSSASTVTSLAQRTKSVHERLFFTRAGTNI